MAQYQVLYDYSHVPTLRRFTLSDKRFRCAMGPFGCIRGDQKVFTEEGLLPISEITRPMRVLSWDEKNSRFVFSLGSGAFPKGRDYLYRVSTPQGEFVSAGHHRVFCGDHKYRSVDNLLAGDSLLSCYPDHSRKISLDAPRLSHVGDPHLLQTISGLLDRYATRARQYGQRLLREEDSALAFAQTQAYARTSTFPDADCAGVRMDGPLGQLPERIHQDQSYDLIHTGGYSPRVVRHGATEDNYSSLQFFSYTLQKTREVLQPLLNFFSRQTTWLSLLFPSLFFFSYASPSLSEWPILSIKRLGVKEVFWDIQVLDTNNYVTEDGTIHHNSGKSSACVMEIVRRAHMQHPGPDGIRRTRWAVVRNCYSDDTEILTEKRGWQLFKDLLPDDKVATLVNDRELVFVKPLNYYKYPYDGEMIGFKNRTIDFLVTPEHKLYASMINGRTKETYGYKFHKAEDIYGMTHYKFKKNADQYNSGSTLLSEKFFEFLGFWFAEGSCGKYIRKGKDDKFIWNLNVVQKENEDYVYHLLKDCGFMFGKNKKATTGVYTYNIYCSEQWVKELVDKLVPCGKAITKRLPDWIKCAPRPHLVAFLRGYEIGDGHTRTHKNDSTRLYTSSECLANDLQEIIIKAGGSASLNRNVEKEREGSFSGQGFRFRLTVHQPSQYEPQTQKQRGRSGWYKKKYKGMVYCVEVPSHVIVTRRNGIVSMNSQSYGQLKDTTIKTFHDWFPPKLFGEYRVTDHTFIITKFPGVHLEVMFRALDRPDQVSNLLSLEVTAAWFNEAREIPKTIIEAMDARIGRYPSMRDGGAAWHGIIMDTNPPDEDSYLYKMFEKVKPEGWEIFKQPSGLSPMAENVKNLAKNYYRNLSRGKDPMYTRVYIHGQYGYIVTGKPVFQSFSDNAHVAPKQLDPEPGLDLILGFDFGLQPACAIGQVSRTGQLRILDELVSDGMGLRQFCNNQLIPLLRQKYFGMRVAGYGDPSGASRMPTDESTCFDILHSGEIGLNEVVPAMTNAIIPRIGAVEHFLNKMYSGEPGFVLSPNCSFLRKALNGGYHYGKEPKSLGENYKPMPVKNFSSHISDALQMLCLYLVDKEDIDRKWKRISVRRKTMPRLPAEIITGY